MAGSFKDPAGSSRLPPIAAWSALVVPGMERAMERGPQAFSQAPGTAGIVWKTALRKVLPVCGLDNGERMVPFVGTVVRAGPAARDGRVRAGPTEPNLPPRSVGFATPGYLRRPEPQPTPLNHEPCTLILDPHTPCLRL